MKTFIAVATLCLPFSALALDEEALLKRIEQLEQRVEVLEGAGAAKMSSEKVTQNIPSQQSNGAAPLPAAAGNGFARVEYWLGKATPFTVGTDGPLASGRIKLDDRFSFSPRRYGVSGDSSGVFPQYLDPSLYPNAGLSVLGTLLVPKPGRYTLHVKATPPREVGGAGNVEVAMEISLNGERVFYRDFSSSLSPAATSVEVGARSARFEMRLIARSPGFGPSPTRATVYVGIQGEGTVSSEPLAMYLSSEPPRSAAE